MSEDHIRPEPALAAAAGCLAAARSLDDVVAALRGTVRRAVQADGIAVVLRDGDLCHYAAEDASEPLWLGHRFPMRTCVSGWAMLHGETAIIPDIETDPRVPLPAYRATSVRSMVMVPVGDPEPVAALGAYWFSAVLLDARTVARLEALAGLAAAALARIGPGPEPTTSLKWPKSSVGRLPACFADS